VWLYGRQGIADSTPAVSSIPDQVGSKILDLADLPIRVGLLISRLPVGTGSMGGL